MSFNMTTITMGLLVVAAAAAAALLSMLVTTTMTTMIPTAVYAQIILNNTNSSSINNNTTNNNSSSMELQGALAPDRIEAMAAQDPEFSAFQEMYDMCLGYTGPIEKNNATIPYDQCVSSMQQSVDKWCNLAAYQKDKCETASMELGLLTTGFELRNILRS